MSKQFNWDIIHDDNERGIDIADKYPELFGWENPIEVSGESRDAHEAAVASMPLFEIVGNYGTTTQADLWLPIQKALGAPMRAFRQITGSCVGNGGGQAANVLMALEIHQKNEPEEFRGPSLFWLYPYGRSRFYAGMTRPGSGSFGSTMAKAMAEDGMFSHEDLPNLPRPTDDGGLTWGEDAELFWSAARNHPADVERVRGKHTFTAAKINNTDEAVAAITNGYPLTCASMWGGSMRCDVDDGVLLNRRSLRPWPHQMCVIAFRVHPKHGRIFYIMNSWGPRVHGKCPTGAPEGGFWVREDDLAFMIRSEVYAFSNYKGFPARNIWDIL